MAIVTFLCVVLLSLGAANADPGKKIIHCIEEFRNSTTILVRGEPMFLDACPTAGAFADCVRPHFSNMSYADRHIASTLFHATLKLGKCGYIRGIYLNMPICGFYKCHKSFLMRKNNMTCNAVQMYIDCVKNAVHDCPEAAIDEAVQRLTLYAGRYSTKPLSCVLIISSTHFPSWLGFRKGCDVGYCNTSAIDPSSNTSINATCRGIKKYARCVDTTLHKCSDVTKKVIGNYFWELIQETDRPPYMCSGTKKPNKCDALGCFQKTFGFTKPCDMLKHQKICAERELKMCSKHDKLIVTSLIKTFEKVARCGTKDKYRNSTCQATMCKDMAFLDKIGNKTRTAKDCAWAQGYVDCLKQKLPMCSLSERQDQDKWLPKILNSAASPLHTCGIDLAGLPIKEKKGDKNCTIMTCFSKFSDSIVNANLTDPSKIVTTMCILFQNLLGCISMRADACDANFVKAVGGQLGAALSKMAVTQACSLDAIKLPKLIRGEVCNAKLCTAPTDYKATDICGTVQSYADCLKRISQYCGTRGRALLQTAMGQVKAKSTSCATDGLGVH